MLPAMAREARSTQDRVGYYVGIFGVAVLALLVLAVVIGAVFRDDHGSTTATSAVPAPPPPVTASPNPTAGNGLDRPLRMRDDGTYKIDDCLLCVTPPGTYEVTVPDEFGRAACKWTQRTDLTGTLSSIIDSGAIERGQSGRVAVRLGEYLTVKDCPGWVLLG